MKLATENKVFAADLMTVLQTVTEQITLRKDDPTTTMLVAADLAEERDETGLHELLKWLAGHYSPHTQLYQVFATGSRVYGTPKEHSDFDWVLRLDTYEAHPYDGCPHHTFHDVLALADTNSLDPEQGEMDKYGEMIDRKSPQARGGIEYALRFGPVNVLVVVDSRQWDAWWYGTDELRYDSILDGRPRTRDEAVAKFQANFRSHLGRQYRNYHGFVGSDY